MKMRLGFVSNSSSSSFSIFGVSVDFEEVCQKLLGRSSSATVTKNGCDHEFNRNTAKFCPDCGRKAIVVEEETLDAYDVSEITEKKHGLTVHNLDSYDGSVYVGLDPNCGNTAEESLTKLLEASRKLKRIFGVEPKFFDEVIEG